jgi:hypothetical protein
MVPSCVQLAASEPHRLLNRGVRPDELKLIQ